MPQAAGLLIINWNDADILASSTREQHRGTFYGEVCLCRSAVRWDRNKWRPHLGPASQKKEACDMEAHTQPNSIQMVDTASTWRCKSKSQRPKCSHGFRKFFLSFWHCPKRGRGDPCPNLLTLFSFFVVPYVKTSISCYVILFGHF